MEEYMKVNVKTIKKMVMVFFRPDGRIYKELWKDGKQNGEGEFFNPK